MIERYRDHAANERTYLAWVRTGITVMVLGFIVEKFEIFLASLTGILTNKSHHFQQGATAEYISLSLATLGVIVIIAGTIRFFRIKSDLDSTTGLRFKGTLYATLLTLVLVGFGIYLIVYMRVSFSGVWPG